MKIKEIGCVTPQERDIIQALYERRSGLNELAKVLTPENTELYEKLVKDLGKTSVEYDGWWSEMAKKYSWESVPDGGWEIDFSTCKIYLVTEQ